MPNKYLLDRIDHCYKEECEVVPDENTLYFDVEVSMTIYLYHIEKNIHTECVVDRLNCE